MDFLEHFKVMLLNPATHILGVIEISSSEIAGTLGDPGLIFGAALKVATTNMILCNNHPSGNLQPGESDRRLTRVIKVGAAPSFKVDCLMISVSDFSSFQILDCHKTS